MLAGDPGQVERVDRDAVPAQPGAGIERLEAERLGLGRVDHLPDVDAHAVVEHLQLVDQGDVDGAVGVFEDLAGLGHLGAGDGHDADDDLAVERRRPVPGSPGRGPPTTFGIVGAEKSGLPGILALGAEGQEEVAPGLQAAGLQDRQDDLAGGARIGRALQDDELAGPQPCGDRLGRS